MFREYIESSEGNSSIQHGGHREEPPPEENWSPGNIICVFFGKPLEYWCDFFVSVKIETDNNFIELNHIDRYPLEYK